VGVGMGRWAGRIVLGQGKGLGESGGI